MCCRKIVQWFWFKCCPCPRPPPSRWWCDQINLVFPLFPTSRCFFFFLNLSLLQLFLLTAWDSNSWPQDEQLLSPPTEPARLPVYVFILLVLFMKLKNFFSVNTIVLLLLCLKPIQSLPIYMVLRCFYSFIFFFLHVVNKFSQHLLLNNTSLIYLDFVT